MLRRIRSFLKSKKQQDENADAISPRATPTTSNKRLNKFYQSVKKKTTTGSAAQPLKLEAPPPPAKPVKPSIYQATADVQQPQKPIKPGVKFDASALESSKTQRPSSGTFNDPKYARSGSSTDSNTKLTSHSSAKTLTSGNSLHKISRKSMGGKNNVLNPHEQAFLPGDLLYRLGQSAGQLPPAPSVFSAQGAVLFVDVSGFTALAERLGKENVPVVASEKLAATITRVLQVLAKVALDGGGEVGKFAGDALLCVWESDDLQRAENLAKHAAVEMLVQMQVLNKKERVDLQIHGGVAKGSIVHFHFGSQDDDLRWYLVSGEAAVSATTVVDVAKAGEFCCQDEIAKGLPQLGETRSTADRKTLTRGRKELAFTILTADTKLATERAIDAKSTMAVLKDGLPKGCNVYIPSSLRSQLVQRSQQRGEMRRKIAICFVEISALKMTETELMKHTVNDQKLDMLNNAFVTMTRIVHAFEGEVRDMLFDDKGCVYIGMWGAHIEEENEMHPWNVLAVKAAMAICNEVAGARAGVSFGTCFVGMAGVVERRTDFVVVGHEVNMAARYMSLAKPGQVLVSSGVWQSTKHQIKYGPEQHVMVGKGKWAKDRSVYTPLEESSKRASFQASYRGSVSGAGLFVGRQAEFDRVETTLRKIAEGGKAGVLVLEAPLGRGKTAFVKRVQKMGKGKLRIVSGQATSQDDAHMQKYGTVRQVVESYTGIRPSMTQDECLDRVRKLEQRAGAGVGKVDLDALAHVLPWVTPRNAQAVVTPAQVAALLLTICKLSLAGSMESAALVVLDNVQWFDLPALEMMLAFLDGLASLKSIALFMTFRESETQEPARQALLVKLRAKAKKFKNNSLWLTLPPLSKQEVKELAGKFIGVEPDDDATNLLYQVTKGDPSFLIFAVQWLEESSLVQRGMLQATINCTAKQLPQTCAEMIRTTVDKLLSAQDAKALRWAAASGGGVFDCQFVSECSNGTMDTKRVVEALCSAAEYDFVESIVDRQVDEKWRFAQDVIYQALRTDEADRAHKRERDALHARIY